MYVYMLVRLGGLRWVPRWTVHLPPQGSVGGVIPLSKNNTNSEKQNWVQSDDPHFIHKVKIIYKIIKSNHHRINVSGTEPPPTIRKTTANLVVLIKPASPNDITQTLLEGNAENWQHNTILILRQHYEGNMSNGIQDLAEFPTLEWEGPFQVASAWASRNLGCRLKAETLRDTQAFLKANLREHLPPVTTADQDAATAEIAAPAVTAAAAATGDPTPPTAPVHTVTVHARVHTNTTMATRTKQRDGDWSPFMVDAEEEYLSPPLSPITVSPPPPLPPFPLFPLLTSRDSQVRRS